MIVASDKQVAVTLSPIPWYRGTAFNSPFGPLANGEIIAAPIFVLMGGNVVRRWLRGRKRIDIAARDEPSQTRKPS